MRKGHVSGDDDFDSIRPASAYGDFQPTDYVVDPPRIADVLRRCESTMIPGVCVCVCDVYLLIYISMCVCVCVCVCV